MGDVELISWAITLATAAALALIPASIAKSKGRSFGLWWFYGWVFFMIALVHSLLLRPDPRYVDQVQLASGGKKCPFCAEVIKQEAVVCRFCGRDLPAAPQGNPIGTCAEYGVQVKASAFLDSATRESMVEEGIDDPDELERTTREAMRQ